MKNIKVTGQFDCGIISFETGNIPYATGNIISFFGSKSSTYNRFNKAIWHSNMSGKQREKFIHFMGDKIYLLSHTERLMDLFIFSIIHRFFNIAITSAKLYIDSTKINNFYKYILSLFISALPILFLTYVVGCPINDLILYSCIQQFAATAFSYISISTSNFLRRLDLISDQQNFNYNNYGIKIISSLIMDTLFSLALHGKSIYLNPFEQEGYHNIKYCMRSDNALYKDNTVILLVYQSLPLVRVTDKLIWFAGRIITDFFIVYCQKIGVIKDIRFPFVKLQTAEVTADLLLSNKQKKKLYYNESTKKSRKLTQERRKNKYYSTTNEQPAKEEQVKKPQSIINKIDDSHNFSLKKQSVNEQERSTKKVRQAKVKKRPVTSGILNQNIDNINDINIPFDITRATTIGNNTFYKIEKTMHFSDNTWGILDIKDNLNLQDIKQQAIEKLKSGRFQNNKSNLGHLGATVRGREKIHHYEIRLDGKNKDFRVLGKLRKGNSSLDKIFTLGKGITIDEELKKRGGGVSELSLIIFDKVARHKEINKSMNRAR